MTESEQKKRSEHDVNAIRDMINEGGLGADVYYMNESTGEETKVKS